MNKARKTFSMPRSIFESLDLNETLEFIFSDDLDNEYRAARNATYRYNKTLAPKKFGISFDGANNKLTIKRVK